MSQHISVCEHCSHVHCGQEQCIHHINRSCTLYHPNLSTNSDGNTLMCWDEEHDGDSSADDPSLDYW